MLLHFIRRVIPRDQMKSTVKVMDGVFMAIQSPTTNLKVRLITTFLPAMFFFPELLALNLELKADCQSVFKVGSTVECM